MAAGSSSSSSLAESSTMAAQRAAHSALARLDDILASSQQSPSRTAAPPTPSKKRMMERAQEMSVSTPALMDLLPARKKPRMTVAVTVNAAQSREKMHYDPHSTKDLLDRLATYTLSLWNDSKPPSCSAVEFARQSWRCTGKRREELVCQACEATWTVESVKDWRSEQGQQVATSIRSGISSRHAGGCPWRDRPCPANLYRIPTSLPPAQLLRTLLGRAIYIPTRDYSVAHPLSEQQLEALQSLLTSERCLELAKEIVNGQDGGGRSFELRHNKCILALFGWQQLHAAAVSNSPSGQTILSCTYCARRILLKPSGSASPASSVNVRSAHRRWCAYLQAEPDTIAKEEPWLAIFNAITRQKPSLPEESLQALAQDDDTQSTLQDSRLDKAQTKNAVLYVKQLLAGGRGQPRRQGLGSLSV